MLLTHALHTRALELVTHLQVRGSRIGAQRAWIGVFSCVLAQSGRWGGFRERAARDQYAARHLQPPTKFRRRDQRAAPWPLPPSPTLSTRCSTR